MQLGYCKDLIIRGNVISGENAANKVGIYVWGTSRYNDQPGENVIISENQIEARMTGVSLNGTTNVQIANNLLTLDEEPVPLLVKRTEKLVSDIE